MTMLGGRCGAAARLAPAAAADICRKRRRASRRASISPASVADCKAIDIPVQCGCHSAVKARKVDWCAMKRLLVSIMIACGGFGQTMQVHRHRGARAMRPENTLPAFEYAIAQGVDALELDMAVTRDNVIVVDRKSVVEAPVCTGPGGKAVIHELTLAEVREWDCGAKQNPAFPKQQAVPGTKMPTLEEVFALAP